MVVTLAPSGIAVELPDRLADLAAEFGSSMMDRDELLVLAAAASLYPPVPGAIVVEIGTYVGRTAVFLAKAMALVGRQVPVLSIDAFDRVQPDALNPQGSLASYLENVRAHALESVCMPLIAFSADAAAVVPERIGLLVVDGGHSYQVTRSDLQLYAPKVLRDGIVFVDDCGPAYPEVVRAVDEFFTPDCPFALLHRTSFLVARRTEPGQGR